MEQILRNYEYDRWANAKVHQALTEMASPPERAVSFLAHIVFAKRVWLSRLKGGDPSAFPNPWPTHNLEESGSLLESVHGDWMEYLGKLDSGGLKETIRYQNTQGKPAEAQVGEVLGQVSFHGHYHRGQLATLIHQGGGTRPNTDYISFAFETGRAKAL